MLKTFVFLFTSLFFISCSHLKKDSNKSSKLPKPNDTFIDQDENLHSLIETTKSDDEIEKEIGSNIDQETPDDLTDAQIKRKHENSHFLKIKKTKRVKYWINFFAKEERARFQRFLNNGEKYRPLIEKILEEEEVPKDLFYVGLIESGYYLGAKSVARATGPWQFIRGTGRRYGLKVNHEIDERRDIEKATRAAARYFKDLYEMFDSWELALASYNAGEFGMLRRINKHKMKDYYDLSRANLLPKETINYVPKVIAAMYVVDNAEKYGFHLPTENSRLWSNTKKMVAPKNTTLKKIGKDLKISTNLLSILNPELSRNQTPKFWKGSYQLRVPSGQTHYVYSEPTPVTIYKAKSKVVKAKVSVPKTVKNKLITYFVRKGDTMSDLSEWFSLSIQSIKKANQLKSNSLRVGQKLQLPNTKKGTYVVKRGDYLLKVANKFKLPSVALIKLNNLKNSKLKLGQKLVVNLL
jgi:membrane-bound lytic murein transglycosylase D